MHLIIPKIALEYTLRLKHTQKHVGKFLGYLDKHSEISKRFPRSTPPGKFLHEEYHKNLG